ncbi:MAG: alpha/beta hydrolase [Pseudomonadota bacterium]
MGRCASCCCTGTWPTPGPGPAACRCWPWRGGVAAVDLPGHGYSSMEDGFPAAPAEMAALLPGLLDQLETERAVLVGHSLGGAVALFAAAAAPTRVTGLGLVSPFVYPQPAPPGLRAAARFPNLFRHLFASPPGRAAVGGLLRRASSVPPGEDPRQRALTLLGHLDAPGGWIAAQRTGLAALSAVPDTALVRAVPQPCVVFWGLADAVRPVALGERLVSELGGPTALERVEGAGHNLHEEQPEAFCARLLAWAAPILPGWSPSPRSRA